MCMNIFFVIKRLYNHGCAKLRHALNRWRKNVHVLLIILPVEHPHICMFFSQYFALSSLRVCAYLVNQLQHVFVSAKRFASVFRGNVAVVSIHICYIESKLFPHKLVLPLLLTKWFHHCCCCVQLIRHLCSFM